MNSLRKYHDDLWKQSRKELKNYLISGDYESLLHFRSVVDELNSLFTFLSFVHKNFKSSLYLKAINAIDESARELSFYYLLQSVTSELGYDEVNRLEHRERLKNYYRNGASNNSNSKQKGNRILAKVSDLKMQQFATLIFKETRETLIARNGSTDLSALRGNLNNYILINNLLGLRNMPTSKSEDLIVGKKLLQLIRINVENKRLLGKFRWAKKDAVLKEVIHKITIEEKRARDEIMLALENLFLRSNS